MNYDEIKQKLSHADRTSYVDGWQVIQTIHGVEREIQRLNSSFPGGWESMLRKIVNKIQSFKNARSGEAIFRSSSMNQSVVVNVDTDKKQLRIITVPPRGKHEARKAGTLKAVVESLEVIELDDTIDKSFDTEYIQRLMFEDIMQCLPVEKRMTFDEFMRQK